MFKLLLNIWTNQNCIKYLERHLKNVCLICYQDRYVYIYILSKQPNNSYFILFEKNKVLRCYHNEHQPDGDFNIIDLIIVFVMEYFNTTFIWFSILVVTHRKFVVFHERNSVIFPHNVVDPFPVVFFTSPITLYYHSSWPLNISFTSLSVSPSRSGITSDVIRLHV